MPAPSGRLAFLLGAGASVPAGMPLTRELTNQVSELLNDEANDKYSRAFNYVCSQIIGFRGRGGVAVSDALNIERVVSSIRLLAERDDHEASPFINSWSAAIADLEVENSQSAPRYFTQAYDRIGSEYGSGSNELAKAIRQLIREEMHPPGHVFAGLEPFVLSAVIRLLSTVETVDYLKPLTDLALTQAGGLDVATLNYDLSVETACEQFGVSLSRGVDNWQPGTPPAFDQAAQLRLYKMHGSIDWTLAEGAGENSTDARQFRTLRVTPSSGPMDTLSERRGTAGRWTGPGDTRPRAAVVLGDREKLSADGPTLPLYQGFSYALQGCARLIVVGYGFADAHINRLVRNWLAGDTTRQITVVDPFWPEEFPFEWQRKKSDLRADLVTALMAPRTPRLPNEAPGLTPRMSVMRLSAGLGMKLAIGHAPSDDHASPAALWITSVTWREFDCDLYLAFVPPESGLFQIQLRAISGVSDMQGAFLRESYPEVEHEPLAYSGSLATRARDMRVTVSLARYARDAPLDHISLTVSAETSTGALSKSFKLDRSTPVPRRVALTG